jgi:outer membrane translocation and assembly module TamA
VKRKRPNEGVPLCITTAIPTAAARALVAAGALALGGCTQIPHGRSAIDDVDIQGTQALDASDVADKLATGSTEKFFGLFRGVVYDYEVYDPSVLQRDMARVERYYRGKGFLEAHARVGRVIQVNASHVRIEILVEEGAPTLNRIARIEGLVGVTIEVATAAHKAVDADLPNMARFDEESFASAKDDLKQALTDRGYAYAQVEGEASIDLATRRVDYLLKVVPGPLCTFGKMTIVGLDPDREGPQPQEIDEAPLRRAIDIDEGEPFSSAKIEAGTQALLDLEVFSAARIDPDLPRPPPEHPVIALNVSVEPTKLRQIRAGGGLEFDEIKTDLHLLLGWEDHNFLGGLRDFSVDFKPGAVLYPLRIDTIGVTDVFPEERLKLQFRQPSFLEARTSFFVKPEFNVYPFLVVPDPPANSDVLGYVETKGSIGLDRPFGKLSVSVAYNAQAELPFYYKQIGDAPPVPTIVLAYPQLVTKLDLRDDPTHPHEGIYLANDLQIANAAFGSSADDVRVQPEVRAYVPLGKRVTLAARASVGFLFPTNYGVASYLPDDNLTDGNRTKYIEETYFRGFTSGGPSSNRGYPIRGIAPYGYVPFLLPAVVSSAAQSGGCTNSQLAASSCAVPIAGLTLWELSLEARFQVSGPFSTAAFCDAGDVSPYQTDLRFTHLHLSCGVGARYDTPVGPIRFDIGYRIQPLQVIGFPNEKAAADPQAGGNPVNGLPPEFLGAPVAISFGIGEAY